MDREIKKEKDRATKNMILSYTKFAIAGGEEDNNEVLLNDILCSFLEEANDKNDLKNRYDAFKGLDQLIKDSLLFDLVIDIASQMFKDENMVSRAFNIYNGLIVEDEYKRLSSCAGYRISPEFGIKANYYTDNLKKRVNFYYDFRDRFFESYKNIMQGEVIQK